ncbi:MAG: hypothetical protein ACJ76A_07215 [Actinomycetota bacterium]|jgi:hypothetical protein
MVLSDAELDALEHASSRIALSSFEFVADDYIVALFDTVLDYQNQAAAIEKAEAHYRSDHFDEIRTLDDLEAVLERFPGDRDGNDELAQYLWGNHHWRRAQELRGLVRYFRERNVTTLRGLRTWATKSQQEDFVGHIKGLGPAVYRSLAMRMGVDTVKPDVHVLRFVSGAIGRKATQAEAVDGLTEVATRLGVPARDLDWSVLEYQKTLP